MDKSPLGMAPYFPTHNHGPDDPCPGNRTDSDCPYGQWVAHTTLYGNPYPAFANPTRFTIDKHMAWLCIGSTFAAGIMVGMVIAILVISGSC